MNLKDEKQTAGLRRLVRVARPTLKRRSPGVELIVFSMTFNLACPFLMIGIIASASSPALAAGVPVIDGSKTLIEGLINGEEKAQTTTEGETNDALKSIGDLHKEQIDQLDATLGLLTGGLAAIGDLEGLSGYEATEVYPIDDNNPYADRLFGDARVTIEQMIIETAKKFSGHPGLGKAGISPVQFRIWFQSLIKQESNFSIGARSHVGAFGLTQIMPGTAKDLGIYPAYYDSPRLQLEGGAKYFLTQMNQFGSVPLALAAYNAGPGNVMKYSGIPPFKETQNYVVRITANYNNYASKIGGIETVGSLSPKDMAIAETSNISDAGISYGMHSTVILQQSVTRLKEILQRVPATTSAKEAMDLNSYARAEVIRIATVLVRLQAAQRKVESAQYGALLAAYAQDEIFLDLGE
ncbi:MAG: lytic transglycosylase domain-containing protein [Hyphomicrobiaceae bacterium]